MKAKVLILGCFFGVHMSMSAHDAGKNMADAATKFLAALNAEQKGKATFDWKDEQRFDWHYIPKDRKGLPLKEMKADQQRLAHALLLSGLSDYGYGKATNIISLELILQDMEGPNRRIPRDPALYYFSIFGKPDAKATWGWRVEGHHLSVNFAIVNGELVASTPSFFGSNPGEVRQGPRKGLRVLADEEDSGRQLVKALSADQRKAAIFSETAPKEIITEAKRRVEPLEKAGITADKLDKDQRGMLMKIIEAYVNRYRPALAEDDLKKIKQAGVEKISFAWAGGVEKGEGHYYRIQGPTFLIEYDNTQNNNNHIHSVWRDFKGDFGEDLLQKHYRESAHR